ncbi:MAG: hypothetical protein Q4D04_12365, partial [Clostridia bacterium]|nr:hypothetical protein [Clostridia bacterium]
SSEYDEDCKLFYDSFISLLSYVTQSMGMEPVSTYSEYIRSMGFDISMDFEYISDLTSAAHADMIVTLTSEYETFSIPMQIYTLIEGENARTGFIVDTVMEDVPISMSADSTVTARGEDSINENIVMSMSVGEDEDRYNVNMNIEYDKAAQENAFSFDIAVDNDGNALGAAHLGYTGTSSIADRVSTRAGRLTVSADAPTLGSFEFGIDLGYSNSPFDSDAFEIIDSKPVIDIAEITEEQSEQMTTEATVIGISALGELMQTPGMAEIITMLMNFTMQSAEMYTTYDDIGYDYEDWEDIEGWSEEPAGDTAISA